MRTGPKWRSSHSDSTINNKKRTVLVLAPIARTCLLCPSFYLYLHRSPRFQILHLDNDMYEVFILPFTHLHRIARERRSRPVRCGATWCVRIWCRCGGEGTVFGYRLCYLRLDACFKWKGKLSIVSFDTVWLRVVSKMTRWKMDRILLLLMSRQGVFTL